MCLKGKWKKDPEVGLYFCPKCGAVSGKKSDLCETKKIKEKDLAEILGGKKKDMRGKKSKKKGKTREKGKDKK